jgi:hypothetical protein
MNNQDMIQMTDESGDRYYFAQIPLIVTDYDMSLAAYRLYGHIKQVCGDDGTCWQSRKTLAKNCRLDLKTVTRARKELEDARFIRVDPKYDENGILLGHNITIINIWRRNLEYAKAKHRK